MKILVRAPNWIGDAVMAIPAIQAIRQIHQNAEIVILARSAVDELFHEQSFAQRVIVYENTGRHKGLWGRETLIRELRAEKFQIAVLLQNAFEAAWLAWRAAIPTRIGYARDARSLLLTQAIPVAPRAGKARHQASEYLELVYLANGEKAPETIRPIELQVSNVDREAAEAKLVRAGVRSGSWRCAIAPGATYGSAKCWAPDRFATFADRLISECDADIILFGSPAETEIAAQIITKMRGRLVSMVGNTSMGELAALFSACSLFVGNDSGAMHVAAAAGLPVIGIFGPTDPEQTAPITTHFSLIREPVSCSPCFLRTCPIDHRCMTRIEVASVFAAAASMRDVTDLPQAVIRGKGDSIE